MYRKSQHILPEKSHNLKKNMLVSVPYILRTRVIRRFSHVETVQLTLPDHLSSPSVFSAVRFSLFLVFCVMFCESLCSFVLFRYRIVSSVLRYAATTYLFWYLKNSLTKSLIYSLFTQFRIFFKLRIAHLLFNYLAG